MQIDIEFNEGDDIFFIHEAKVVKSTVRGFKIDHIFSKGKPVEIIYLCNSEESQVNIKVPSPMAFPSKESLIKSL